MAFDARGRNRTRGGDGSGCKPVYETRFMAAAQLSWGLAAVQAEVREVAWNLSKLHRRSDCASSCAIATWPMASTSFASG
jgi:hypothetical protein